MIRALSQISRQQAALARAAGALLPSLSASAAQAGTTVTALRSPAAMSAGVRQLLPAACRAATTEAQGATPGKEAPSGKEEPSGKEAPYSYSAPFRADSEEDKKEVWHCETADYMMMHPVYTQKWVQDIKPKHKVPVKTYEKLAYAAVQVTRSMFDLVTNYGPQMNEKKWLRRVLFLETVAGVPGMVGGMLRHMRSLRTMRRDYGRIHTLLQEAENERMHLLTFMQLAKPGLVMRSCVLVTQGIFFNFFFVLYIISPRTAHSFVGYLEEEAVLTYTHVLRDLEAGKIPAWSTMPAPDVAKTYWRLKDDATMHELLLAVRADEAGHSHVNHTFSEIGVDAKNPFAGSHLVDPMSTN